MEPVRTRDRRAYRLDLRRDSAMLGVIPDPPHPRSLTAGVLLWEEPRQKSNVTHYRIYSGETGQLFVQVPVGQTRLVGFDASRALLASYDSRTGLESSQALVAGTTAGQETYYLLIASSTDILSLGDAPLGTIKFLVIDTDATDGRQIVWAADFEGVDANSIDNGAERRNIYGFFKRSATWACFSRNLGIDIS